MANEPSGDFQDSDELQAVIVTFQATTRSGHVLIDFDSLWRRDSVLSQNRIDANEQCNSISPRQKQSTEGAECVHERDV